MSSAPGGCRAGQGPRPGIQTGPPLDPATIPAGQARPRAGGVGVRVGWRLSGLGSRYRTDPRSDIPPVTRSRRGPPRDVPLIAVGAVCVAFIAVLVLLWQRGHLVAQSTAPHAVTYRTEGTAATTTVVFRSPTGTKKEGGVVIPLTTASDGSLGRHFTMYAGTPLSLSVKNETAVGSVTCIIEIDGAETDRQTSNDPFATATCHSSVH